MNRWILALVAYLGAAAEAGPGTAATTRGVGDGPPPATSAADATPAVLVDLPSGGDPVVETVVFPDGKLAAFVTRGADGDSLWLGDDRRASCEELGQVAFTEGGGLAWWCRNGEEHTVCFDEESAGPFLDVSLPNLDALSALSVPTQAEWGFRAGTRSVLAARDARGDWQSYLRYSAAPSVQEKRGLPTTVTVYPGPDASIQKARAIRYRLLQGKVPLYTGTSKREECVYLGTERVGCGQQVSMLAWASTAERLAFAVTTPEGLLVYGGSQVFGPTRNLDWVAFSPDGLHLAYVVREGEQQTLVLDGERHAASKVVESVVWTRDNRLVYLAHDEAGSHLFVDGAELFLRDLITGVYVSPRGEVSASGTHKGKPFLHPAAEAAVDFESLWGEGFLAGGELYGVLRLAGGRMALLQGGRVSDPFDGLSRLTPSQDGRKLAAVGSTPEGDRVLVDGSDSTGELTGRAEQLSWCGSGRVLVRERKNDADCAYSGGGNTFCCPRMVMAACGAEGAPDFVCLDSGKYWLRRSGGEAGEPFDEVPPHLVWQDLASGTFDFAGRRGAEWFLVTGGVERPAGGRPLAIRPFLDSPWFLVSGNEGFRWMTREGDGAWFTSVSPPFDAGGWGLYRGREKGMEWWVLPKGKLGPADELSSAPIPVPGGMCWWERAEGRSRLRGVRW